MNLPKYAASVTTALLELDSTSLLIYVNTLQIENEQGTGPVKVQKVEDTRFSKKGATEANKMKWLARYIERTTSPSDQKVMYSRVWPTRKRKRSSTFEHTKPLSLEHSRDARLEYQTSIKIF